MAANRSSVGTSDRVIIVVSYGILLHHRIGCATGFLSNVLEFSFGIFDTCRMTKKQEAKNKGGRPKLGKKTVSIRLSEDVLARVRRAAEVGGNLSAYIEQAIKERLQKDNIE
jgi:hypothetical protein